MQPDNRFWKQKRKRVLSPHDDDGGGVEEGMVRGWCPAARESEPGKSSKCKRGGIRDAVNDLEGGEVIGD